MESTAIISGAAAVPQTNVTTKQSPITHTLPSDILDDLASRFIINVPRHERNNLIRICFQIELAHWFYLDFYSGLRAKKVSSCGIKQFATHLFQHIPFLRVHLPRLDKILENWKQYKMCVPTFGAILMSEDFDHVLLVQSYWARSSWSFPKGKVNENEDPVHCASREVYEETGYDISQIIQPDEYIEAVIHDQYTRLYIIRNIPLDTLFEPKTRKEIKQCDWFPIELLPINRSDTKSKIALGISANSFFMIIPFVKPLKKWVQENRTRVGGQKLPNQNNSIKANHLKRFEVNSRTSNDSVNSSIDDKLPISISTFNDNGIKYENGNRNKENFLNSSNGNENRQKNEFGRQRHKSLSDIEGMKTNLNVCNLKLSKSKSGCTRTVNNMSTYPKNGVTDLSNTPFGTMALLVGRNGSKHVNTHKGSLYENCLNMNLFRKYGNSINKSVGADIIYGSENEHTVASNGFGNTTKREGSTNSNRNNFKRQTSYNGSGSSGSTIKNSSENSIFVSSYNSNLNSHREYPITNFQKGCDNKSGNPIVTSTDTIMKNDINGRNRDRTKINCGSNNINNYNNYFDNNRSNVTDNYSINGINCNNTNTNKMWNNKSNSSLNKPKEICSAMKNSPIASISKSLIETASTISTTAIRDANVNFHKENEQENSRTENETICQNINNNTNNNNNNDNSSFNHNIINNNSNSSNDNNNIIILKKSAKNGFINVKQQQQLTEQNNHYSITSQQQNNPQQDNINKYNSINDKNTIVTKISCSNSVSTDSSNTNSNSKYSIDINKSDNNIKNNPNIEKNQIGTNIQNFNKISFKCPTFDSWKDFTFKNDIIINVF